MVCIVIISPLSVAALEALSNIFPFPALLLIHLGPYLFCPVNTVPAGSDGKVISAYLSKIEHSNIGMFASGVNNDLFCL